MAEQKEEDSRLMREDKLREDSPEGGGYFGSAQEEQERRSRSHLYTPAQYDRQTGLLPDLYAMTNYDLIRYLEEHNINPGDLSLVAQSRMTGPQWAGIYGEGDKSEGVATLKADFPSIPPLSARQLIVDAKNARDRDTEAAQVAHKAKITLAGVNGTVLP
jgi:hypothetical protein